MSDHRKICFITCVKDEEWYSESLLYLKHLARPTGMTVEFLGVRGAVSMAVGYNEAMRRSDAKYKVYMHQDTLIVNHHFISDLLSIFSDPSIGILGVIGCRSLPASGIWWDGMRCYGRVLHACESESVVDSELKEPNGRYVDCEAVDGLMMATQYDLSWREDLFTGWHFYDTSQCMEFRRHGWKVVVPNQTADFWCIHCPVEKPLAPEYKEYQKIFLREYGGDLRPEV